MRNLFSIASLIAVALPVQAQTIYLIIKSEINIPGTGVALHSIPMNSIEQCEEMGAIIVASERFDPKYAKQDGFECIEGK